ncbi:hypothetical protein BN7_1673 [Wickerhamomyces ciferrii]|uniref:BolA-like protein n=1 Tax=Wickerhamomyces ciferrii (strain ATCC 14091 / BCRC 22168 / CBS 111 / JCM 3599 / NBRC 0793 / NRRL Y-1031 F-60-10) TaxID=1206466 RepID=K0KL13_WICCF|nr:uncharacterized protein BN7_1673 [Wickerhamomyces ciferrii]CCH42129.1 hypothetical protein BN7_1673 [Wickerhamomyces ciferrii]
MDSDLLKQVIQQRLEPTEVYVEDMSGGCGQAFAVIIVSEKFKGKNKLMRSRIVNKELSEIISSIHAFTQKTFTPEEFETQRVNFNL